MTTIDCLPEEILEKIVDCVNDFYDQVALSKVSRLFHGIVAPCVLPIVTLKKLGTRFNISVSSPDPVRLPCSSAWITKESGSGEVTMTYIRNVSVAQPHSLFNATRIRHVNMHKMLPIFIDNDSVEQLSTLLSNCYVDKITVIFDKRNLKDVSSLPSFLASIRAKHIEFLSMQAADFDPTAPFLREGFIASLVQAGIREVTFSAEVSYGANLHAHAFIVSHTTSFRLLTELFAAGISRVTVNRASIIEPLRELDHLNTLIECFNPLGKPLHLTINQRDNRIMKPYEGPQRPNVRLDSIVLAGHYAREDDEQYGRRVECAQLFPEGNQDYRISIEYNPVEQA